MRIYFTTDLHGSEKCWLKFLGTSKFYSADVIIVGGDITGKFIVPIVKAKDGTYEATFLGRNHRTNDEAEIDRLKLRIANTGHYAFETYEEEYAAYKNDPGLIETLFRRLLLERVEHWVALADDRLSDTNVRCFVSGGNDDLFEIDDILKKSKVIQVPEGRIIDLGGFEMLSLGYANITPWNCVRDIPEEELSIKIETLAQRIQRMDRAIFNIHVPPFDSSIDQAPKLTPDLQVVMVSAEPEMIPVGSTAVRDAIQKYQPMLGLHGHIHESRGFRKLGKTTIVNPGSEYSEGVLRGALIDLDQKKGIVRVNLVSG